MEKQQNNVAHPIRVKAAVTFLVVSSVASIVVLLMNRAGDLGRESCMTITALVAFTGEHSRALPSNLTLRWISSALSLISLAWDAYSSYIINLQTSKALAIAVCELMVGTCFTVGCLLAHSYTLAHDNETLAHRCDEILPILIFLVMIPPYNLCFKTVSFAWICLFRQGTVGHSQLEKRILSLPRLLLERGNSHRSSLAQSYV